MTDEELTAALKALVADDFKAKTGMTLAEFMELPADVATAVAEKGGIEFAGLIGGQHVTSDSAAPATIN